MKKPCVGALRDAAAAVRVVVVVVDEDVLIGEAVNVAVAIDELGFLWEEDEGGT